MQHAPDRGDATQQHTTKHDDESRPQTITPLSTGPTHRATRHWDLVLEAPAPKQHKGPLRVATLDQLQDKADVPTTKEDLQGGAVMHLMRNRRKVTRVPQLGKAARRPLAKPQGLSKDGSCRTDKPQGPMRTGSNDLDRGTAR